MVRRHQQRVAASCCLIREICSSRAQPAGTQAQAAQPLPVQAMLPNTALHEHLKITANAYSPLHPADKLPLKMAAGKNGVDIALLGHTP